MIIVASIILFTVSAFILYSVVVGLRAAKNGPFRPSEAFYYDKQTGGVQMDSRQVPTDYAYILAQEQTNHDINRVSGWTLGISTFLVLVGCILTLFRLNMSNTVEGIVLLTLIVSFFTYIRTCD